MQSPFDDHVKAETTQLFKAATGSSADGELLWGDGVQRLGPSSNGRVQVRARGRDRKGWVRADALGGQSLLEIYFIDVGQGDGILIKTPDFRHIVIDGGHPRRSQSTGKSAADFIDWKFFHDYAKDKITLDAMIASHNDLDHYGGLADLLDTAQTDELDADTISVERFYHAGVSWWKAANNGRTLGTIKTHQGRELLTQLLGDRTSARNATSGQAGPQLQGLWGDFIAKVVAARTASNAPTPIARVSRQTGHLPGFSPGGSGPTIKVLGPVEFDAGGAPGLPKLGADSKSTNGNSVLLRLDYGRARILLTGDLNKASQRALLDAFAGNRIEFQCDVAKACHHGSDDVSFEFLQVMNAGATVISSGDGEGHDHPRPRIVAASGVTGYLKIVNDEIITPLVYSTELARSVAVADPAVLSVAGPGGQPIQIASPQLNAGTMEYRYRPPGALNAEKGKRKMGKGSVVAKLIYGLVNVRTDGETILTATMNEGDDSWSVKSFKSRF
jgi:beta-lactamase superfamily II metal-dependent hydrolase